MSEVFEPDRPILRRPPTFGPAKAGAPIVDKAPAAAVVCNIVRRVNLLFITNSPNFSLFNLLFSVSDENV